MGGADDGVGGRRNEGGAVLTHIRSSTLPELNTAIYHSSCDHLPILSEGTRGDSCLSPWLVQMGQSSDQFSTLEECPTSRMEWYCLLLSLPTVYTELEMDASIQFLDDRTCFHSNTI